MFIKPFLLNFFFLCLDLENLFRLKLKVCVKRYIVLNFVAFMKFLSFLAVFEKSHYDSAERKDILICLIPIILFQFLLSILVISARFIYNIFF